LAALRAHPVQDPAGNSGSSGVLWKTRGSFHPRGKHGPEKATIHRKMLRLNHL
jgi:hypothetical protein